jgi:hypothetical protein
VHKGAADQEYKGDEVCVGVGGVASACDTQGDKQMECDLQCSAGRSEMFDEMTATQRAE